MKQTIKKYPLIHPTTIVLVGTMHNGKANFTTIGDIAVAGINPPLIMISLNENHNATKYVYEHNKMSINIPEKDLLRQVDFAGMYSSKEVDKSGLVEYEIIDGLPIVNKAPISLIVKTKESIKIKQRVVFVCEVIETIVEDKLIRENRIDLSIVEPILYGLDNIYYSGLTKIGVGYQEGKKLNE